MKKNFIFLTLSLLLSVNAFAYGEEAQEVQVKKISQDLYQSKDSKIFIKTRYCYESAYSYEDAVLRIDNKYGYNIGKLIFKEGKSCDVEKVYKESR